MNYLASFQLVMLALSDLLRSNAQVTGPQGGQNHTFIVRSVVLEDCLYDVHVVYFFQIPIIQAQDAMFSQQFQRMFFFSPNQNSFETP